MLLTSLQAFLQMKLTVTSAGLPPLVAHWLHTRVKPLLPGHRM
jgi:hypothetical protein